MEETQKSEEQAKTKSSSDEKHNESESGGGIDGIIPKEILESIPVEDRGKFISVFQQSMFSDVMSRSNPISEKITSEHITKLIDNADNQDIRDRAEIRSQRYYNLIIFIIGLIFLGFLIVFLKDDKDLLYKIIIAIISFVGGFGIGRTKHKKED